MSFLFTNLDWTKRERLAIMILSSFLFLFFLADIFFDRVYPETDFSIPSDSLVFYKQLIVELEAESNSNWNDQTELKTNNTSHSRSAKKKLHNFDPNDLDLSAWLNLGFSKKQSQSLLNYKKSIGGFKNLDDFSNSFVVSEKKFIELKPFIKIRTRKEEGEEFLNEEFNAPLNVVKEPIEINSVDSITLLSLKGIGPFYAGKIIAYREDLGGLVSKYQLLEIWKFDSSKLQSIIEDIYIDTSYLHLLKMNSDSLSVFYKHPYIDWNTARAIVNYRDQHGEYSSKEDLKKLVLINDSLFLKLYPYLSL